VEPTTKPAVIIQAIGEASASRTNQIHGDGYGWVTVAITHRIDEATTTRNTSS